MKAINVYFDDDEFEFLKGKKGKQSWRQFILRAAVCYRAED